MFEVWKPPGWEVTVTDGEEEQVVSNSQESVGGAVKGKTWKKNPSNVHPSARWWFQIFI